MRLLTCEPTTEQSVAIPVRHDYALIHADHAQDTGQHDQEQIGEVECHADEQNDDNDRDRVGQDCTRLHERVASGNTVHRASRSSDQITPDPLGIAVEYRRIRRIVRRQGYVAPLLLLRRHR